MAVECWEAMDPRATHVQIHGNRIVQKGNNKFLYKGDGLSGKDGRVVRVVCPLDGGTIH